MLQNTFKAKMTNKKKKGGGACKLCHIVEMNDKEVYSWIFLGLDNYYIWILKLKALAFLLS